MHDEARTIRERHADLLEQIDRLDRPDCPGETVVAATTTATLYPSAAGSYYAMNPVQLGGAETEGASATTTADATRVFYAYNLGSTVPPAGTKVLCHSASGRWNFRFDA